jgi:frataxin-like iron-binding protein CyaY
MTQQSDRSLEPIPTNNRSLFLMEEKDFFFFVEETLEKVASLFEDRYGQEADVDLETHQLTVTLKTGVYLLTPYTPQQQLWLSSPASGGLHFSLYKDSLGSLYTWQDTRFDQELMDLLKTEIKELTD